MALVVENGTGLPTAESYVSVADAVARLTALGDGAAFLALVEGEQEKRLRQATEYLDLTFGARWQGVRLQQVQSLDWPRSGAEDRDGWSVGFDSVPTQVKHATIDMAANAAVEDVFPDVAAGVGQLTGESKQVGPLEVSRQYSEGSARETKYYRKALAYVQELLVSTSEVFRA